MNKFLSSVRILVLLLLTVLAVGSAFRFISRLSFGSEAITSEAVFPPVGKELPLPNLTAQNIFVIDRKSKKVLFEKNADQQIYPASTTKMMTALVAYETYPLDRLLTVDTPFSEGVNIRLTSGEQVSVDSLLYALLVQSANDSAEILARNHPGGRAGFIADMNSTASRLRLFHTSFVNPTGLDEENHYSSAADLARLADHLLTNNYLAKIVATENAVITSTDQINFHPLTNVNQLLGKVSGVMGVKTGFTDLARESVVTYVNRDGHEVIISLLGSDDRFNETKSLIDWVYDNFTWRSQ